ncbi:MAG: type II toxin-antitoxin system YafQ family toxin [Gemmatimonadota bacterium]
MTELITGETLELNRRPHPLKGEYWDCMECHLGGDWLLIWQQIEDEIVFVRTGTHEDLFG